MSRIIPTVFAFLVATFGMGSLWAQSPGRVSYADPPMATHHVSLKTLAELLAIEDEVMQWEFAGIGLDVLIEVHGRQLESILRETRGTAAARKKIIGWRRGVDDYIAMLEDVRRDLDDGLPLSFFVDALQQVVVAVGERVVILSPPRGIDSSDFEQEIVDRFCANNDCAWLGVRGAGDEEDGAVSGAGRGTWSYGQNEQLQYRVGERYGFEFDGFSERNRKALIGDATVIELEHLAQALAQADTDGYPVDWRFLADNQPVSGRVNVVINAGGDYLGVRTPLLARLRPVDWSEVVRWIRQGAWGGANGGYALIIRDADMLLGN